MKRGLSGLWKGFGGEKMAIKVQRIPFKVSARTARLIGRENIATAKGAIIELVKNSYDADSKVCIVYFDNYYSQLHNTISNEYHEKLLARGVPGDLLNLVYILNEDGSYSLKMDISDEIRIDIKRNISKLSSLYIIDAGEGMTQKIIQDHWMTIGTDNKMFDLYTKSKRIKSGAKGIGRFALDKLGSKCEMITLYNPEYHNESNETIQFDGYRWNVNWEDFEGEFKTLESVNAELTGLSGYPLYYYIKQFISQDLLDKINFSIDFKYGTILKITELRDNWESFYVEQLFSDLEILVPPKENNEFRIFLLSSLEPKKYGEVLGSICDDYDYKLIAKADDKQNVHIKIIRKEYDMNLIPRSFFDRMTMQKKPYTLSIFQRGFWEVTRKFSELIPGFNKVDEDNVFRNIGIFEFTFYYLKRMPNDTKIFFSNNFNAKERKEWLDKFGGIKIFRDNFRVRPYGEKKDAAFDWLNLGIRKAKSPAGIAKKDGGWRVEPESVAGIIKISRLTNVDFEDKSSREGLQENKTFQIFKQIIENLINIFEEDRAYIAKEMDLFYKERFNDVILREKAENLVKEIIADHKEKHNKQQSTQTEKPDEENEKDEKLLIVAQLNEQKDEEIEKLKEEQKLLRILASCGLVLASFSHDLSKINDVLENRFDKFKDLISQKISEGDYNNIEDRKNPFKVIERMKKDDIKMKNWLNFSLGAARKDKRKRKQLFLRKYFENLRQDWETIFENRGISIDLSRIEDIDMRAFEIDFDSVFSNLFVNTIDAFVDSKENRTREIRILLETTKKEILIDYVDNGPGLSKDIANPDIIFKPMFTTKKNPQTGEDDGTGLGMWIIKSIVEENEGKIKLLFPKVGFGVRMTFPIKYRRG